MVEITKAYKLENAMVPVSLATATESTAIYVDAMYASKAAFVVTTGAMSSGKKTTVTVYGATASDGTGKTQVAQKVVTLSADATSQCIAIDAPISDSYRYYAVTAKTDQGAAVIVGAVAMLEGIYQPF